MLFLRRFAGEGLYISTATLDLHIRVTQVDAAARTAQFLIDDEEVVLAERDIEPVLQGLGRIKIGKIQGMGDAPPYVSIGFDFPRSFVIRRDELMRGTTPLERQAIARAEALGNRWTPAEAYIKS